LTTEEKELKFSPLTYKSNIIELRAASFGWTQPSGTQPSAQFSLKTGKQLLVIKYF